MDYRIEPYSKKWEKDFFSFMEKPSLYSRPEAFPGLQHYRDCPNCRVEKDIFIACRGGRLLGYAALVVEKAISRVIGDIFVFPCFRRNGIGMSLMESVRKRTRRLAVQNFHIPVYHENAAGRAFLNKLGFVPVKQFLEMETSHLDRSFSASGPFETSAFSPDEIQRLADIQNRIFAGSWGFNPNCEKDILYYKNLLGSDWNDILRLKRKGKEVGYIWTCPPGKKHVSTVHMCGLLKENRGKGMSRALLAAGLFHLVKQGAESVRLTVDADNQPAVKLYRSMGFSPLRRIVWFEEELNQKSKKTKAP